MKIETMNGFHNSTFRVCVYVCYEQQEVDEGKSHDAKISSEEGSHCEEEIPNEDGSPHEEETPQEEVSDVGRREGRKESLLEG